MRVTYQEYPVNVSEALLDPSHALVIHHENIVHKMIVEQED